MGTMACHFTDVLIVYWTICSAFRVQRFGKFFFDRFPAPSAFKKRIPQIHKSWGGYLSILLLVQNHLYQFDNEAWRRFSNYIFIFDLTPGFSGLGKDNFKTRREIFKIFNLVRLMLAVWWLSIVPITLIRCLLNSKAQSPQVGFPGRPTFRLDSTNCCHLEPISDRL